MKFLRSNSLPAFRLLGLLSFIPISVFAESASDNLEFRSIDGSENNLIDVEMNKSESQLSRRMPDDYADQVYQMAGFDRPGPREISNAVSNQDVSIPNPHGLSDFFWQWGQFLDHDIDLTESAFPSEPAPINVPPFDPYFDPSGAGNRQISFSRSIYDASSGTGSQNPRQQTNGITGWIDASNVYGSDDLRAETLRAHDGTGRLRTSSGRLLPFNTTGLPNAGGSSPTLFLGGDVRANEQVGLTALHVLFVREHNRLANRIRKNYPGLSGDEVYQRARRMVGAQMQVITYKEFLPALLGKKALSPYAGYDQSVDARIMNGFSTAAFRFGHSMLNSTLLRLNKRGREIRAGHLPLRNAFFSPDEVIEHGVEPIFRGLAAQLAQNLDPFVVHDVRNFLFGAPGADGFDLASLNIQRGRDHGLPSYNDSRQMMGLPRVESFAEISSDAEIQNRLQSIYLHVDQVDIWVGGLSEDRVHGAVVGELFYYILKEQFEALRNGDRFWFESSMTRSEIRRLRRTTLAKIIRRNTRIGRDLQDNVFYVR